MNPLRWLRQCLSLVGRTPPVDAVWAASVRWWQENAGSMEQRWPPLPDPAPSVPVDVVRALRRDAVRFAPIGDINEALARHELDFLVDRCRDEDA